MRQRSRPSSLRSLCQEQQTDTLVLFIRMSCFRLQIQYRNQNEPIERLAGLETPLPSTSFAVTAHPRDATSAVLSSGPTACDKLTPDAQMFSGRNDKDQRTFYNTKYSGACPVPQLAFGIMPWICLVLNFHISSSEHGLHQTAAELTSRSCRRSCMLVQRP
jgi:hypothetical protein